MIIVSVYYLLAILRKLDKDGITIITDEYWMNVNESTISMTASWVDDRWPTVWIIPAWVTMGAS